MRKTLLKIPRPDGLKMKIKWPSPFVIVINRNNNVDIKHPAVIIKHQIEKDMSFSRFF